MPTVNISDRMTLYHFANCLALAYTPYYLTYKFTGLAEYGAFWKVKGRGLFRGGYSGSALPPPLTSEVFGF